MNTKTELDAVLDKLAFKDRLTFLISCARDTQKKYASEIEEIDCVEDYFEEAIGMLESTLEEYQTGEKKEHANSSAANYKDYMAEENATTGRED